MANRLPTPGGDNGNWGQVLNDYLSVAHNNDGTLNASAVSSAIPASSINKSQLASAVQASLNNADAAASGTIADNSVTTTKIAANAVTNAKLDSATQSTLTSVAAKANDSAVLHLAGAETVTGAKNFTGGATVNGSSIVVTSDTRLTDQRTPIDGSVTNTKLDTSTQTAIAKANSAVQTVNGIAPTSGNVVVAGNTLAPTNVKTSAYTAAAGDLVLVDTTSGNVVITLPVATPGSRAIGVKLVTLGGSNTVTVNTSGSDVFNKTGGSTSATLSLLNQGFVVVPSTGLWVAQSTDLSLTQLDGRYVNVLGTSSNPVTSVSATRPGGLTVVHWLTTTQPTNLAIGDIWEQA